MIASLPIRRVIPLAKLLGVAAILSALLATPVQCLCGDPYPSPHALLEFILVPRTIIHDDGISGMAMTMAMTGQTHSQNHPPAAPATTSSGTDLPPSENSTTPAIRGDGGHLERAGSYSALAGLLLVVLVAMLRRPSDDAEAAWRGDQPHPATPPPRLLLAAT